MFVLIDHLFKFLFKTKILRQNEEEYDHKTPVIPIMLYQSHQFTNKGAEGQQAAASQNYNQNVNAGIRFFVNETDTKSSKEKKVNRRLKIGRRIFKSGTKRSKGRGA